MAIYLSFKPKVILLDEPTSALDDENSYNVIKNILSFSKENGICVLIISHDMDLAHDFADKIVSI